MSYNRKLLKQMIEESKQKKPQPKPKDRIVDLMGQWNHPGEITRIPSNRITMQGVPYPVEGVGSTGQKQMMYPGQEYVFPGSTYVDEYPLMQARNGGEPTPLELAKIKAKMALESHFGNPSARRMTTPYPQDLVFKLDAGPDKGKMGTGTHWMGTIDNYAVPSIQENVSGKLFFKKNASPRDREAIRFNSPEEALMFAENYKEVAPMSRNNFRNGGDISIPNLEEGNWLDRYDDGGLTTAETTRPPIYTDDPRKVKAFSDSSKLRQAYEFQKNNFRPGYEQWLDEVSQNYSGGKEALRKIREKNMGKPGTIFKDKRGLSSDGFRGDDSDYDPLQPKEKSIVNYYKSLIGNDPNFRIGKHSSPDLWHKKIKPIASYYDGAYSPVYPEPVQPYILQKPQPKKTNLINVDPRGKKGVYDPATNSIFGQLDKNVKYKQIGESLYEPIASIKKPVILQQERPQIKMIGQDRVQSITPSFNINTPARVSTINRPKGNYAVDYFDENLQPQTNYFPTPEIADMFMKERMENKMYGPSMTRRGVYKKGGQTNWLDKYN